MAKNLLTTREAGAILGVNDSRIRQLLISGELKGRKHGPVWLIDRRSIDKLVRTRRKA